MKNKYLLILLFGAACNQKPIETTNHYASVSIYNKEGKRYVIQDTTSYPTFYEALEHSGKLLELEKRLKPRSDLSHLLRELDKKDGIEDKIIFKHNLKEKKNE